jgi:uncharacterized protein YkwD
MSILLVLCACGGGGGGGGGNGGVDCGSDPNATFTTQERDLAAAVLDLVNEERTQRGLDPLLLHDQVEVEVAWRHSVDMRTGPFFAHVNPCTGQDVGDRLDEAGIGWQAAGENIARGQPTPEAVMSAWMSSQGHRDNILNPVFTHLGVGVEDAPGGPWWTQVFIRP